MSVELWKYFITSILSLYSPNLLQLWCAPDQKSHHEIILPVEESGWLCFCWRLETLCPCLDSRHCLSLLSQWWLPAMEGDGGDGTDSEAELNHEGSELQLHISCHGLGSAGSCAARGQHPCVAASALELPTEPAYQGHSKPPEIACVMLKEIFNSLPAFLPQ